MLGPVQIKLELADGQFSKQKCELKSKDNQKFTHLFLHLNFSQQILSTLDSLSTPISSSPFQHVIFLNLGVNRISSLDLLSRIYLPSLEQLHLFQNQIVNLKGIRKCKFPNLKYLSLVVNHILRIDDIQTCNFPQLQQLCAYDNQIIQIQPLLKSSLDSLGYVLLGEDIDDRKFLQYQLMRRFNRILANQLINEDIIDEFEEFDRQPYEIIQKEQEIYIERS